MEADNSNATCVRARGRWQGRQASWPVDSGTATTEDKKTEVFTGQLESIRRCCGTHPVAIARVKRKEGTRLCSKSPRIWVCIACCFHIKNWSDHSHLCQVGHHKIILASGFCLPLFLKNRSSVQFSSRWYLCTQGEKTICTPPHLSEFSPQ